MLALARPGIARRDGHRLLVGPRGHAVDPRRLPARRRGHVAGRRPELRQQKKILPAGQTIALDPVWLSVEENGYDALERYGDAVAALAPKPLRTGATALWCSWYPIRMGISEEIILAQAAIAAKHFKPLGLDVMQMDHGWQRGDVCGDWMPNERFPHGLKWLSEQLQSRYGMKLGLWIAPTQVAFTTPTVPRSSRVDEEERAGQAGQHRAVVLDAQPGNDPLGRLAPGRGKVDRRDLRAALGRGRLLLQDRFHRRVAGRCSGRWRPSAAARARTPGSATARRRRCCRWGWPTAPISATTRATPAWPTG